MDNFKQIPSFIKIALIVVMATMAFVTCAPKLEAADVIVQRRGLLFPRVTRTRVVGRPAAIVAPQAIIGTRQAIVVPHGVHAPAAVIAPQTIIVPQQSRQLLILR